LIIFYIIVQELFVKLTGVAGIASDVFVGRERFATILLMRLTETVILWLSDDQAFWDDIERTPLGPLGLQQVECYFSSALSSKVSCFCKRIFKQHKCSERILLNGTQSLFFPNMYL
jgi:hypothetical protein